MKFRKYCCVLIVMSLLPFGVGCGGGGPSDRPDLGQVTGKVTMDGKPLANAVLTFQPDHARPSYARTDSSGNYEMIYTNEAKGATIGQHIVLISTQSDGDADAGIERSPETVPAKYNVNSELTASVKAGSNEINFDLSSEGEIIVESDSDTAETDEKEKEKTGKQ